MVGTPVVVVLIKSPVANEPRASSFVRVASALFVMSPDVVGAPMPAPGQAPQSQTPGEVFSTQSPGLPPDGRPLALGLDALVTDTAAETTPCHPKSIPTRNTSIRRYVIAVPRVI